MLHEANGPNGQGELGFGSSSSPGRPFDFGDLNLPMPMPTFLTPGRDFGGLGFEGFGDFDAVEHGGGGGHAVGAESAMKVKIESSADGEGGNRAEEA